MLKRYLIAALSVIIILCFAGCKEKPISPERQRLLVFGASLAEKNDMGYERIFDKNKSFKNNCKDVLASAWEITDNASARIVLDWLLDEGIRAYSDEYYNADEIFEIASARDDAGEEAIKLLKDRLESYDACVSSLKKDYGYADDTLENVTTAAAFDYDRLVTLARWCYACEYLSEDEFWGYAQAVADAAVEDYGSWDEYFAGIVLGKAVRTSGGLSDIDIKVADKLINSKNSPYQKYPFAE